MTFFSFLIWILLIITMLISLSFFTLFERKILGYLQFRKGPNKVSLWGILQPFSDALKLISKQFIWMTMGNFKFYILSPFVSLVTSILVWQSLPYMNNFLDMEMSALFFLCCLGVGVYSTLIGGWSSNSSFSYLGGMRAVSQSISYEVSLSIMLLIPFFLISSLSFFSLISMQYKFSFMFLLFFILLLWLISILSELNRAPFDFAEGESELVSGFNIEFSGMMFGLFFMGEYLSMLMLSYFSVVIFFGYKMLSLKFLLLIMVILLFIIWIRGTLPRFRYDFLMYLCWKGILPFVLLFMVYILMISFILN